MKQLYTDIVSFLRNLSPIDFLLFFSILVLIILVVSLIYIIKTNDEEEFLDNDIEQDINLEEVVSTIEKTNSPNISLTNYEKDQEEKAIISYEELLEKNKEGSINYNDEAVIDDEISVRKIDLDHIINDNEKNQDKKINVDSNNSFKFAKEEEFLQALKTLNKLLN